MLFSNESASLNLRKHIDIPIQFCKGLVKCRIVYGCDIDEITYSHYIPKKIHSLKLVKDDAIDYSYKLLDRKCINNLYAQRGNCDDILVVKNGKLTDSSFSNIALFRDKAWYTPTSFLLLGTRRQQLIDQGRLVVKDILEKDIKQYEKVCLINSMIGLNKISIETRFVY